MAGRTTCTTSKKRKRYKRCSIIEPGLGKNGRWSECIWEAKENYGTGGKTSSGCEMGQSGLDARADFAATSLSRLI
jgi:hypothetical protein